MIVSNVSAAIASAATEQADYLDIQGSRVVGLYVPSTFTGTSVTFKGSLASEQSEPVEFVTLNDASGADIDVTVAAGEISMIGPDLLYGVRFVKLVAAAQAADVEVGVILARG